MIENNIKLLEENVKIIVQGLSFISAIAAIVAGFLMMKLIKKFGTGILASGFKSIATGVIFIAFGIFVDSIQDLYFNTPAFNESQQLVSVGFFMVKAILFVIGTYIIVIGSKRTGDKLESLTK